MRSFLSLGCAVLLTGCASTVGHPVTPSASPSDSAGPPVTPVTEPPPPGASAPAAPSATSSRFKAELLQDKDFRMAFEDVRRLGVALDFQERQFGLLQVTVGPGFATVSSARYNLEHLYIAYRIASYRRVDPVIELWKEGAKIGEVTADGVLVGPGFTAPR